MFSRLKTIATIALAVVAVASSAAAIASFVASPAAGNAAGAVVNQPAPEFTGIDKWLNSDPLTMQQLRGKVVLVDFWTYTCINCIHVLPYVETWNKKYKDQGLVVVGVHTPEYSFERETDNVQKAIKRLGVTYPVAQDNHWSTRRGTSSTRTSAKVTTTRPRRRSRPCWPRIRDSYRNVSERRGDTQHRNRPASRYKLHTFARLNASTPDDGYPMQAGQDDPLVHLDQVYRVG